LRVDVVIKERSRNEATVYNWRTVYLKGSMKMRDFCRKVQLLDRAAMGTEDHIMLFLSFGVKKRVEKSELVLLNEELALRCVVQVLAFVDVVQISEAFVIRIFEIDLRSPTEHKILK